LIYKIIFYTIENKLKIQNPTIQQPATSDDIYDNMKIPKLDV